MQNPLYAVRIFYVQVVKPFVYARLLAGDYANTLKTARKMVENGEDIVWEILEKVIYQHPVLLNRAPTLHRLSLIAFEPVLIEGKAIRLHPLVCKGFNADFDGDQMSVHVPISLEAQLEARTLMLSTNNVLSPANGEPMTVPSQDMVLGVYYISLINGEHDEKKSPRFANMDEVMLALENKTITLHTPIYARVKGQKYATTAGRMMLGELLPDGMPFDSVNKVMPVKEIKKLLAATYEACGDKAMILLADALKDTGFEQAVRSGISIGFDDIVVPSDKEAMIEKSEKAAAEIESQYQNGLLSSGERHNKLIDLWQHTTDELGDKAYASLGNTTGDNWNSIHMMALSGARGSKGQIQQLAGMRGMMQKPDGSIIEVPIISNFKEGLTMSEYFTSTHGARKGMSDTALKTATAGYLTRRLVDVAQDVVVTETDCGTERGIIVRPVVDGGNVIASIGERILGRTAQEDILNPENGEVLVPKGKLMDEYDVEKVEKAGVEQVKIRSVLTCESEHGVCAACYGRDLARGTPVNVGEAVGIIAAQSIGEPGTQLTMRTFHVGGAASVSAEQSSVEIPFAGVLKLSNEHTVEDADGNLIILSRNCEVIVTDNQGREKSRHRVPYGAKLLVKLGTEVEKGKKVAEWDPFTTPIISEKAGKVELVDLITGVSVKETQDETTGIVSKVVTDWRGGANAHANLRPSIVLKDKKGEAVTNKGKEVRYYLPVDAILAVDNSTEIHAGDVIARLPKESLKSQDITGGLPRVAELFEARKPKDPAIISDVDGVVEFGKDYKAKQRIMVITEDGKEWEYLIPKGRRLVVQDGDVVKKGDMLVEGTLAPHDILRVLGIEELAQYLVKEVQAVYRLQGVKINDKHIEVIVSQMLRKVEVTVPGDTTLLVGEQLDADEFEAINQKALAEGGKPAEATPVLLGITKASLQTKSFISAASFQETTRVLTEAAVEGKIDRLHGLKENVIVGRLVPAGTGSVLRSLRKVAAQNDKEIELQKQQEAEAKAIEMSSEAASAE